MNYLQTYLPAVTFLLAIVLSGSRLNKIPSSQEARQIAYQGKNVIRCTPDWSTFRLRDEDIAKTPVLPGWGKYHFPIRTSSDSAQFYFDQGLNLYYGFHIIESLASFRKASWFDSTSAMTWWGQALAYGPNINDLGYSMSPEALIANSRANQYKNSSTPQEQALISAMLVRYTSDTTISRVQLNQDYELKMKEAFEKFPDNPDIGALYADALMIQHPWDYWLHNGTPRPWTNTITEILEKVLAQTPQHPGANHYYIHAIEASHTPEKALASADRLGGMMPSVSHMVHMPSHIYIRTGYYEKGTRVNESAVKGYDLYKKLMPETENAQFLYEMHNLHMMAANALFLKDYSYAYQAALKTRNSITSAHLELEAPWGPLIQYIYMTPLIAQVRYSRWDEIIAAPWIKESYANARVIQHWARGMAFIGKGDRKNAQMELANMQQRMTDKSLAVDPIIFNPSIRAANVMESILQGRIAENENKLANAQRDFQHAVDLEDDMLYNEPRDWLLPARHYLAENLIRQKKFAQAEEVLREDLKTNPRNYWATEMLSHMPPK